MGKVTICAAVLLFAIAASLCQSSNKGNCNLNEVRRCDPVIYYDQDKDLVFSADETAIQNRCKLQMNCLDAILCIIQGRLPENGTEIMKRLIRSAQIQVFNLCHPNADPKYKEGYKMIKDCLNSALPGARQCAEDFTWDMAAAIDQGKFNVVRFCCAHMEYSTCLGATGKQPLCDENAQRWLQQVVPLYHDDMFSFICSGSLFAQVPANCKTLPPVLHKGPEPPKMLELYLKIAGFPLTC